MARQEYYYVHPSDVRYRGKKRQAETLCLREQEHRHLSRVLRHRPGDQVRVTDGRGRMYHCTIEDIRREESVLRIDSFIDNYGEPQQLELTVAQAVPRESRFEWLLEKGTELGVAGFIPLQTERGEVSPKEHKMQRWQRVLTAAMKQCGRSKIPLLHPPESFDQVVADSERYDLRWIAHLPLPEDGVRENRQRVSELAEPKTGLVLIGPEGGFSDREVALAAEAGFVFLGLGPRRLRSETAGLIAAALLLDQFGELSGSPESG